MSDTLERDMFCVRGTTIQLFLIAFDCKTFGVRLFLRIRREGNRCRHDFLEHDSADTSH